MHEILTQADLQKLTVDERIAYYEQELRLLTPPKTHRERVLANVYQCLLQSCLEQVPAAARNEMPAIKTWSYHGYANRQLRLLWRFVISRQRTDPDPEHTRIGISIQA